MSGVKYVEIEGQFYSSNHPRAKGRSANLGKLETHGPKPDALQTLVRSVQEPKGSKKGVVARARVTLVAYRRRLLDPDAIAYSFKPLTDAISGQFGIGDDDPRIEWSWHQVQCKTEGCSVLIELV